MMGMLFPLHLSPIKWESAYSTKFSTMPYEFQSAFTFNISFNFPYNSMKQLGLYLFSRWENKDAEGLCAVKQPSEDTIPILVSIFPWS